MFDEGQMMDQTVEDLLVSPVDPIITIPNRDKGSRVQSVVATLTFQRLILQPSSKNIRWLAREIHW